MTERSPQGFPSFALQTFSPFRVLRPVRRAQLATDAPTLRRHSFVLLDTSVLWAKLFAQRARRGPIAQTTPFQSPVPEDSSRTALLVRARRAPLATLRLPQAVHPACRAPESISALSLRRTPSLAPEVRHQLAWRALALIVLSDQAGIGVASLAPPGSIAPRSGLNQPHAQRERTVVSTSRRVRFVLPVSPAQRSRPFPSRASWGRTRVADLVHVPDAPSTTVAPW